MKTRYLLLSALVLAIGVSIFYAGTWFGGRRTPEQIPDRADLHVPKTIEQPPKPQPQANPALKVAKPSLAKSPGIGNMIVSDKEYARGKVIDPAGKPLAGAQITVGGAWPTHAVTDSDGKFRIEVPQLEWKPGG